LQYDKKSRIKMTNTTTKKVIRELGLIGAQSDPESPIEELT
jgi:hypothetical protein